MSTAAQQCYDNSFSLLFSSIERRFVLVNHEYLKVSGIEPKSLVKRTPEAKQRFWGNVGNNFRMALFQTK